MNEVIESLRIWREERNLSCHGGINVYKGNMHEELAEFYRAKDINEMIDAICDMSVFTINQFNPTAKAIETVYYSYASHTAFSTVDDIVIGLGIDDKGITILLKCFVIVEELGYDFIECIKETIKEISSRVQAPGQKILWQQYGVQGKWQKWKDQHQDTLYKADYAKCIKKDK